MADRRKRKDRPRLRGQGHRYRYNLIAPGHFEVLDRKSGRVLGLVSEIRQGRWAAYPLNKNEHIEGFHENRGHAAAALWRYTYPKVRG